MSRAHSAHPSPYVAAETPNATDVAVMGLDARAWLMEPRGKED